MAKRYSLGALFFGAIFFAASMPAQALVIDWYQVAATTPDFNLQPCGSPTNCGSYPTDEVGGNLDGNGRPVVGSTNSGGLAESPGDELEWWTPGSPGVTADGVTSVAISTSAPFSQNMFVPHGTGGTDQDGFFQTAILTQKIVVGAGGGSITFGGDDDMFLALNGGIYNNQVVDQLGGIHPFGTLTTFDVGPGTYTMTMFYADRHVVAAFADISFNGNISAVPELSTWAMILLGFAGLGFAGYRRTKSRSVAFSTT
jgi:hypothetical protein